MTIFRKILVGELYFLLLKVDHAQTSVQWRSMQWIVELYSMD